MSTLKEQFDLVSKRYDAQRPMLIPCFHDLYTIGLPLLEQMEHLETVLDIGAGTGLFSQFIYEKRPDLNFTLVDISGEMLSVARQRFQGAANVSYVEFDLLKDPIPQTYDLVISSLAIHHLEDIAKAGLYQKIFNALNPGGIFINADQVKGRTPWFDHYFKKEWEDTISHSALDKVAVDAAMERIKLDKFGYLEKQLNMLEMSGFAEVDCIYKYNNFVVFSGKKA